MAELRCKIRPAGQLHAALQNPQEWQETNKKVLEGGGGAAENLTT